MLRKMLGAYFIIQRCIQSNTVKLNFKIFFDIVARKSPAGEFVDIARGSFAVVVLSEELRNGSAIGFTPST